MSHRFKRAKRPSVLRVSKLGGIEARLRRYAAHIENQTQLDVILSQAPRQDIADGFLEQVRPYLKFKPKQFEDVEAQPQEEQPTVSLPEPHSSLEERA